MIKVCQTEKKIYWKVKENNTLFCFVFIDIR